MQKKVKFISPFAGKVKGDIMKCDSMLANQLVNIDKVAKYIVEREVIAAKTEMVEVDIVETKTLETANVEEAKTSVMDKAKNLFKGTKKQ